jgi:hypothetical protein
MRATYHVQRRFVKLIRHEAEADYVLRDKTAALNHLVQAAFTFKG